MIKLPAASARADRPAQPLRQAGKNAPATASATITVSGSAGAMRQSEIGAHKAHERHRDDEATMTRA